MAVKTFTVSEVLTASDTNTYLANSGLVYLAGTTVTSATPYVEFLNCFSSQYDNYRVVVSGGQGSVAQSFQVYLGTNPSTTNHYGTIYYYLYTGSSAANVNTNAGGSTYVTLSDAAGPSVSTSFDLTNPYLTKWKTLHGTFDGRAYAGWFGGFIQDTASYTGFRIKNETGNITAGSFRIYGYRQA